ncbi:uncharacterized protein LOC144476900 [Augochlora pura]
MDGTFSVVPRMPLFHQLYTVHIRYNDTGIGIIFVLCECRTKTMYNAIWRKIVSLVPRLQDNLETVMCDYERPAVESVQAQFPRVTILGAGFISLSSIKEVEEVGVARSAKRDSVTGYDNAFSSIRYVSRSITLNSISR